MKKVFYIIAVIILLLVLSCKKDNNNNNQIIKEYNIQEIIITDTLRILASEDFFELNLVDSLSQQFLDENRIKLIWENGGNKKELINKLANSNYHAYPDLVLGLSNVFRTELDSLDIFESLDDLYFSKVRSNNRFDKRKRFLPYEYSYLSLIKKSSDNSVLPISFGVLQKEEYFDKLIISDAIDTEFGRALFNNIEGIFKFHGYAACWNRIQGSIFEIVDDDKQAFEQFWKYDDKYIFYPVTKVIEGYEHGFAPTMAFSYMSEGSYKIIHSVAITRGCQNRGSAEIFLLWLHKAQTQSLIVKANNWYPIVETASKSEGHRIIDYPKTIMNNKINQKVVEQYLSQWLDYWKRYREKI